MVRVAAPRNFKIAKSLLSWRIVLAAGVIGLLIPSVLMHLVLWQTEQDLDLEIRQKPWFALKPGLVNLSGNKIKWRDRFEAQADTLFVRYPPTRIFSSKLPLSVRGNGVRVSFDKSLAGVVGKDQVFFDHVRADVIANRGGEMEIDSLEAKSAEFHFELSGEKTG